MADRDALATELDRLLEPHAYPDGQVNGLQVEGTAEVNDIVGAVSCNAATIEAARDADALLTHHGLLWHGEPLTVRGTRRARLAALLAADLNLYTYHVPLDAHTRLGNNAHLAEAAGVDAAPAFLHDGRPIGMAGSMQPAVFTEWAARFEATLRNDCDVATGPVRIWPFGPQEVARIGFVSGQGSRHVQDAIDLGLDVFVTGEISYPAYHTARENGMHVVAAGHYLTERGGVQRVLGKLQEQGIRTRFVDVETLV